MRKGANRQANPTHDVTVCVTPADICQLTGVKGAARILDRSEDTVWTQMPTHTSGEARAA